MKGGKNIKLWHPELSIILDDCEVGEDCVIHAPVWIGNKVKIGNRVKIQAFAFIPEGLTIADDCFIGPGVVMTNDRHPPSQGKGWAETLIKKRAVIGANATILPGIIIGEGAIIGAGSVVINNVPDGETWAGVPAKKIK